MPLELIDRIGTSTNSGAPIYKVRCTLCGDVYLVTAHHSQIARVSGCSTCSHAARRRPNLKAERAFRRRVRKVLRERGYRLVTFCASV